MIEICDRLKKDYEQHAEQIPVEFASDLENRWHQTWLNSVEIQCKLEERLKFFKVSYSCTRPKLLRLQEFLYTFRLQKMLIMY